MEHNPRVVFERLFGEGGTTAERVARLREDRSILDAVRDDMARLEKRLGAGDRRRAHQYLDAVREIERRIQRVEAQAGDGDLPENLARPVGIPDSFTEHARLMFDLQRLAFQADVTRVFTYLIGREQTAQSYPEVGVPDAHHSVSHHQLDPGRLEQYAKINTYHVDLLSGFLQSLHATQDGDGSLLDQSLILYGGGISDGDQHSHIDLPLILAGGGAGTVEGRAPRALPDRHPDDQPAAGDAGQGGGRRARGARRQHGAAAAGAADGVGASADRASPPSAGGGDALAGSGRARRIRRAATGGPAHRIMSMCIARTRLLPASRACSAAGDGWPTRQCAGRDGASRRER